MDEERIKQLKEEPRDFNRLSVFCLPAFYSVFTLLARNHCIQPIMKNTIVTAILAG